MPDVNLDDLLRTEEMSAQAERSRRGSKPIQHGQRTTVPQIKTEDKNDDSDSESLLQTMVDATGQLDIDDEGNPDFHGQSSGIVFLRKVREQFGDLMGTAEGFGEPFLKKRDLGPNTRLPTSTSKSSMNAASLGGKELLPRKDCAQILCEVALNDACALMRFVHQPDFWTKFRLIYTTRPEELGDAELGFLPLLYSILALGTLFAKPAQSVLQSMGYERAIERG